ncbi:FAD-binding oxidoreductase [Agreia sp. VKM Ac-1783]|uniref:NAD(P)/FAD-dependent oxidoreductase n=1 Tax=Agreia sp. VKM Ac-1783 TaxID=1938889 RepID=UPI000A2AB6BE|nr:FAD-binding oxidoreductase [Agreia sp. VKM Ac-1783]SMQ57689.1 Glycine/D-amino acid oxidase [Agreia sp. VKM Ac-1783]
MYTDMASPATSSEVPPTADVVIVGGGIAGVSLAAEIGDRARVVLLEADDALFRHTSSRSAQQVQPSYGPPAVRQLTSTTLSILRRLDENAPAPVLSSRILYVIGLDDSSKVSQMASEGTGLRLTSHSEVEDAVPGLLPGLVREVAADDDASEVKVKLLLTRYAKRAQAHGVEFVSRAKLTAVARVGSSYRLTTTAGTVTAPIIVNAAGAWADDVAALAGSRPLGLAPLRRTVILTAPTGTPVGPMWPMIYDAAGSLYFRPHGRQVLASPLEDEASLAEDARPREDVIERTLARLNALTSFEVAGASEAWTGLRTVTRDDVPAVGFDHDSDGFFWLAGQGGYGIQTSAAISILAAAAILREASPLTGDDQQAFESMTPNRFA